MNISTTPAQGPSRGAIVRSWWHRKSRKAKAIWIGVSTFTLMAGIGALLPEESSTASTTDQPTVADAASSSEPQHTTPETLPPAISTPTTDAPTVDAAPTSPAPPITPVPTASSAPATPAPIVVAPIPGDAVAAASVSYTVSRVIDGDTVEVTGSDGSLDTIRVIGIDTPEMDACEGTSAKNAMLMFADGKTVTLTMGGDGEDTDRYGRLLRYIDVDSQDVGLLLIDHGFAVARYDSRDGYGRHDREDTYVAADAASPDYLCPSAPAPVAEVPATPETPPAPPAAPTPPASSVYYENCSAVKAAGAAPIYAGDPGWQSKFDRDNDGIGCES